MGREKQKSIYLKKAEARKIKQLRSDILKEEAEYQRIIDACKNVSSMSTEFDELIRQGNLCSVRIDETKQKILHLLRTGYKNGLSLEKDYVIYLQNRFDL
jgi:hypothetical protein